MTPALRSRAATVTSGVAAAAVCERAPRAPADVRPAFSATMGLVPPTRRAMRANLRGLPRDSRYSAITEVRSSCSKKHSRSFGLTSSLFPTDTKADRPRPAARVCSPSTTPTAPDWETRASRPGSGSGKAKVAFILISGSVFATPRQFGPTIRIPCLRATLSISVSTAAPERPVSPKPAVITVTARTPTEAASSITAGTADAGTATMARSTGSGTDNSAGNAGTPHTARAAGLTG